MVSTREKALASTYGDTVAGDDAETIVYLVTMKGYFIGLRHPVGAKAPTGNYISFVVNAEDFGPVIFGIRHNPPLVAPASFGPLIYLKVGAERGTDPVQ